MTTERDIRTGIRQCLRVFRGRLSSIGGLILVGLLLNATFTIFDPVVTKLLIDKGLIQRNFRLFFWLAFASVLMGIVFRIFTRFYELISKKSQNQTTTTLVLRMLQSYYSSDPTKLPESSPGYYVSRIYDEPASAAKAILTTAGGFCVSVATLIAALGLSVYLSWRLTAILVCIVPFLSVLAIRFSPRVSNTTQQATEEEARVREHLGRVVEAYKTVKIFSLQRFATLTTSTRLERCLSTGYEKIRLVKTYETASQILLALAEACVFVGCGYAVVMGYLTLGSLFAFMSSFWKVMNSGRALVSQYPELIAFMAQIERISEFENLPKDFSATEPADGLVELEQLSVRYGETEVLSDFSFKMDANQRVLVLGANGAGKSTLAKILAGFVAQNQGVIRRIARERVSALITPFYFVPGTLEEHVGYQNLDPSKRQEFRTLTEELGLAGKCEVDIASTFSEGEKKKAQIIMTLLKDASLYILDEPLAHLDIDSKKGAMQWIMRLAKDKGLIVIMHGDEQYHRHFDRIVYLGAPAVPSLAVDADWVGLGEERLEQTNLGNGDEMGGQPASDACPSAAIIRTSKTADLSYAPLRCSLLRRKLANRGSAPA
jgi:ATP-binding cassette subfamily B protein